MKKDGSGNEQSWHVRGVKRRDIRVYERSSEGGGNLEVEKVTEDIHGDSAEELIRKAIEAEGMNQRKLADKMGVTRQNISDFLNRAQKAMRYDSFAKMAKALGYEVILRKKLRKKQ